MRNFASAPGEMFYHFAKKNQTVDELIRSLYSQPSQLAVDHFKAINSHLKNNRVKVGQMVVITPPNSQQCTLFEAELAEVALKIDEKLAKLSEEEARIIAENYQLLNNITSVGSAGAGGMLVYFNRHVHSIERILKQINELYVKTYNTTSTLNTHHFFQQRKMLFARLDTVLSSLVGEARMGFSFDQNHIKKSLGLSTKSALHQWRRQPYPATDVPGFAKNFDKVAKSSSTLKGVGYVGIALDVGNSAVKIHEACTVKSDQQCAKTSFKEGGRLTGSVAGGAGGGIATAYITCNLIFGLESFGTSLLWCGIVAGAAGSYLGGKYTGDAFGYAGEKIYETTYR